MFKNILKSFHLLAIILESKVIKFHLFFYLIFNIYQDLFIYKSNAKIYY